MPISAFCQAAAPVPVSSTQAQTTAGYALGSGDKITVYGEADLSGEFAVNGEGMVSLPLIGSVKASGLTVAQLGQAVAERFKAGYLLDPKVSVEVINFRPYYIMGEVTKTGEYAYTDGINVINAIARAEGFTYRAQQKVFIKHFGESTESEVPLTNDLLVMPGDTIRIGERHF